MSAIIVNGNIETEIRPAIWMNYSGAAGSTAVGIWDSGDSRETLSRESAALLTLTPTSPINPFNAAMQFQNRGTPAAQNVTAGGWLGATLNPPEQTLTGVAAWADPNVRFGTADPAHVFTNATTARPAQATVNGQIPFYKDFNDSFSENHNGAPFTANNLVGHVDPINGSPLPFAYDNVRGGDGRGLGGASNPLDSRTSSVSFFAPNDGRVPTLANNQNPGFAHFVTMVPIEFGSSTLVPSNTATTPSGALVAVNGAMGAVTHRLTLTVPAAQVANYNRLIPQQVNGLDPIYRASDAAGSSVAGYGPTVGSGQRRHPQRRKRQRQRLCAGERHAASARGQRRHGRRDRHAKRGVAFASAASIPHDRRDQLPRRHGRPRHLGAASDLRGGHGHGQSRHSTREFDHPADRRRQSGGEQRSARNAAAGTPLLGTDVTNQFGQFWNFTSQNAAGGNNNGTLVLYGATDPRVISLRDNGILFSVDSATDGLAATAVNQEKLFGSIPQLQPNTTTLTINGANQPNEARGTVFRTHLTASNATYVDELAMGLDPRRRNVDIDAQSLGGDGINIDANLFFSVARQATGQVASAVSRQANRHQMAADIFEVRAGQADVSRTVGRHNSLFVNQEVIGLGPNFGPQANATPSNDNLLDFDLNTDAAMVANAMSNLDSPINRANDTGNIDRPRIGGDIYRSNFDNYFSLADSGIGDGARIFRSNISDLFANGHAMGLADMDIGSAGIDDLDALALFRPGIGPGVRDGSDVLSGATLSSTLEQNFNFGGGFFVFDPNDDRDFEGIDMFHGGLPTDLALFSLAPGSQTLNFFGLSAGDLFITDFDGTFSLFATAESLGLRFHDNLDGLDSLAVPEPATWALLTLAIIGWGWRRRMTRRIA